MKLNVIFSHKASNINKKLIKFFQINLLNFNKANLVFDFEVAHPEESDKYKSMGITNYPVLVRDNEITLGTDKIIHYLKQIVDRYNKKILNKSENEKLDDFWKQTIGKIEVDESGNYKSPDDEEENDVSDDLHHKIQKAFEARSSSTELGKSPKKTPNRHQPSQTSVRAYRSNNLDETPSETLKHMKSKGGGHMDDALMAKFFENQEESV